MQIPLGTAQADLGIDDAAHADAHRRDVGRPHGRVGDHDHVARQPVPASAQQISEMRRAGFLLALDQQLERHRRRRGTRSGQACLQAEGVEQHLALVVR